jgi:hypothetical protein
LALDGIEPVRVGDYKKPFHASPLIKRRWCCVDPLSSPGILGKGLTGLLAWLLNSPKKVILV